MARVFPAFLSDVTYRYYLYLIHFNNTYKILYRSEYKIRHCIECTITACQIFLIEKTMTTC